MAAAIPSLDQLHTIEPRPVKCSGGHVLGAVYSFEGGTYLAMYRKACYLNEFPQPAEAVLFVSIGTFTDCRCSICGRLRDFNLDRNLLEQRVKEI